jgi:hypothetical protein
MNYQLELKQLVSYPRCRVYRQFVQSLIADNGLRARGGSALYHYVALCSLVNYQTSYLNYEGIRYMVLPGEWICPLDDLRSVLKKRTTMQVMAVLHELQTQHRIQFSLLGRKKLVKIQITDWGKSNRLIEANAPCAKDHGFFFFPMQAAQELVGIGRCSELDILLDLWLHGVYNDDRIPGSDLGPIVYFRDGSGDPMVSYAALAQRWGISKTSVSRILKKLEQRGYLRVISFSGRSGSALYLDGYLSTMFDISDVLIDKDEVALALHVELRAEDMQAEEEDFAAAVIVPEAEICVPKSVLWAAVQKVAQTLELQGFPCARCTDALYRLSPLSGCEEGKYLLTITHGYKGESCGVFQLHVMPYIQEV